MKKRSVSGKKKGRPKVVALAENRYAHGGLAAASRVGRGGCVRRTGRKEGN